MNSKILIELEKLRLQTDKNIDGAVKRIRECEERVAFNQNFIEEQIELRDAYSNLISNLSEVEEDESN